MVAWLIEFLWGKALYGSVTRPLLDFSERGLGTRLEWCNIFKILMYSASWYDKPLLSNSTLMDPLNVTNSSPCTCHLSSLACLTSVCSDCLPSCSLWCQRCSLAPDAICLSHSVDSSALSYTVRSLSLRSIAQNKNLYHICKFEMYVELEFSTRKQTDLHTRLAMQSR